MDFENKAWFALKGAKEQNLKGFPMNEKTIRKVVHLLFKPGTECTLPLLVAQEILCAEETGERKIGSILRPNSVPDELGGFLADPLLLKASFEDVRAVVATTLVTCATSGHYLVDQLRESPISSLHFRDGVIFGLLDGLMMISFDDGNVTATLRSFEYIGKCTVHTAVLLCILELIWRKKEGDALPPDKAGALSNLIGEYVRSGGERVPLRIGAVSNFLRFAATWYGRQNCFPSQMAEAVVTDFLYKSFRQLPMIIRLDMVAKAIYPAGPI